MVFLGKGKNIKIFIDNFTNLLETCIANDLGENNTHLEIMNEEIVGNHNEFQESIDRLDKLSTANPMESLIHLSVIQEKRRKDPRTYEFGL